MTIAGSWSRRLPLVPLSIAVGIVAVSAIVLPVILGSPLDGDSLSFFTYRDIGFLGPFELDRKGGPDGGTSAWVSRGFLPWSFNPDSWEVMFRPLGSALFATLYAVLGRTSSPWLVANLVLFAGVVVVAAVLLAQCSLPRSLVALAIPILAVDDVHKESMHFVLGGTHAMPAVILGCLGLIAHIKWRQGWRPGLWIALVLFAAALSTSEIALSALAFVFAFELVGFPSREHRLRAIVPVTLLALSYLVYYVVAGYGWHGSAGHLDPFAAPWLYLERVWQNVLLIVEEVVIGTHYHGFWPVPVILAATAPFLVGALRSAGPAERRAVAAILLGSALSVVPMLGEPLAPAPWWTSDRILLMGSLGVALYWAIVLRQAFRWARDPGPAPRRALAGVAMIGAAGAVFVWSPMRLKEHVTGAVFMTTAAYHGEAGNKGTVELYSEGLRACGGDRDIVWLRNPGPYPAFGAIASVERSEELRPPVVLGEVFEDIVLTRVDEHTIALDAEFLTEEDLAHIEGRRIAVPGGEVRVTAGSPGTPRRMEASFAGDLGEKCFLEAAPWGVTRVTLPPVGQTIVCASEPGCQARQNSSTRPP